MNTLLTGSKLAICVSIIFALENIFLGGLNAVPQPILFKIPPPIQTGEASFYSYECADLPMANGKPFDPEERTCASWFFKFGTVLIIKSLDTGKVTEVTVTDRGPNKRLVKKGRIIDLSKKAFEDICDLDKGLTQVDIWVKTPNL